MSILIDKNTRVLIQGITGKQGRRVSMEMLDYGTHVVAGVTPGKGGQDVYGLPVYNCVADALREHPEINTSLVSVPREGTKDAAIEAISTNGIKLVNILTEGLARRDSAQILQAAKEHKVRVVGPASIGLINPIDRVKIGAIGGNDPGVFYPGEIAIFSKSGGMCLSIATEIFNVLGHGTSLVVGIGGDRISGTNFKTLLELVRDDERTKLVIINGEVGGDYEEEAARYIRETKYPKPVVARITGIGAAEHLPPRLAHGPRRRHHRRGQLRHLREQGRGLRAGRREGGKNLRGADFLCRAGAAPAGTGPRSRLVERVRVGQHLQAEAREPQEPGPRRPASHAPDPHHRRDALFPRPSAAAVDAAVVRAADDLRGPHQGRGRRGTGRPTGEGRGSLRHDQSHRRGGPPGSRRLVPRRFAHERGH